MAFLTKNPYNYTYASISYRRLSLTLSTPQKGSKMLPQSASVTDSYVLSREKNQLILQCHFSMNSVNFGSCQNRSSRTWILHPVTVLPCRLVM